VEIHLRGLYGFVTQPQCNDRAIDTVFEEPHGCRVPQDMWAHLFALERGASCLCGPRVTSDQTFDRIAAQLGAARGWKQRVARLSLAFAQPGGHHADHLPLQRRAPLLAAFAFAAEMRTGPQHDVSAAQMREFGDAEPCLNGEQQKGAIATADPCGDVGRREDGLDFGSCQIRDRTSLVPLDRDRENPPAAIEMRRLADRHVRQKAWMAASRTLRVRGVLRRCCST
jgi:hypothetical protein